MVDDFEVARIPFEAGQRGKPEVPGLVEHLSPGNDRVRLALTARIENRTDEMLPMTLAVIGLPAGLEVPKSVLVDLQEAGRCGWRCRW